MVLEGLIFQPLSLWDDNSKVEQLVCEIPLCLAFGLSLSVANAAHIEIRPVRVWILSQVDPLLVSHHKLCETPRKVRTKVDDIRNDGIDCKLMQRWSC